MNTHSFTPVINKPTGVTNNPFSIIDDSFVNNLSINGTGLLKNNSIDYFPIIAVYKQYFKNINYCNKVSLSLTYELGMSNLYDYLSKFCFNYVYITQVVKLS